MLTVYSIICCTLVQLNLLFACLWTTCPPLSLSPPLSPPLPLSLLPLPSPPPPPPCPPPPPPLPLSLLPLVLPLPLPLSLPLPSPPPPLPLSLPLPSPSPPPQLTVLSSGTSRPLELRGPYDVANLYPLMNECCMCCVLFCGQQRLLLLRVVSLCINCHAEA